MGTDRGQDSPDSLDDVIVGQLKSLEHVSPGFFAQVVDTYVTTSQENLRDLLAAVEAGDLSSAQRRAHALVGSSRQIGATRVGALCAMIEHAASLDDARAQLPALQAALHGAERALHAAVQAVA